MQRREFTLTALASVFAPLLKKDARHVLCECASRHGSKCQHNWGPDYHDEVTRYWHAEFCGAPVKISYFNLVQWRGRTEPVHYELDFDRRCTKCGITYGEALFGHDKRPLAERKERSK